MLRLSAVNGRNEKIRVTENYILWNSDDRGGGGSYGYAQACDNANLGVLAM